MGIISESNNFDDMVFCGKICFRHFLQTNLCIIHGGSDMMIWINTENLYQSDCLLYPFVEVH